MIDVRGLTFAYDKVKVLDNMSFSLGSGQLVAVLGPNGAGKSTLFKCMLGLLRHYDGQILLGGRDIRSMGRKEMAIIGLQFRIARFATLSLSVY